VKYLKGIVCTVLELQMFGYQACHVCAQLEHVLLSHVHGLDENDGILHFLLYIIKEFCLVGICRKVQLVVSFKGAQSRYFQVQKFNYLSIEGNVKIVIYKDSKTPKR